MTGFDFLVIAVSFAINPVLGLGMMVIFLLKEPKHG